MADGFLGRWSRRKQDARDGKPLEQAPAPPAVAEPGAPSAAVAAAVEAPPAPASDTQAKPPPLPTLADAQALTPASDFKPFVQRAVSPQVRNLAMKKLFSDPHFNVMDGLDIYVGDYTQPDPLPAGMLRQMASAHALGFFQAEETAQTVDADDAMAQSGGQAPGPAPQGPAPGVAQSGVCTAVPGGPSSEPDAEAAAALRCGTAAASAPASQADNDQDADLRLQPDDAARRPGAGRDPA